MKNLTASQTRNLEIIRANGGEVLFGANWPTGLNQITLGTLVKLGHLAPIIVAGKGRVGYRVAG